MISLTGLSVSNLSSRRPRTVIGLTSACTHYACTREAVVEKHPFRDSYALAAAEPEQSQSVGFRAKT